MLCIKLCHHSVHLEVKVKPTTQLLFNYFCHCYKWCAGAHTNTSYSNRKCEYVVYVKIAPPSIAHCLTIVSVTWAVFGSAHKSQVGLDPRMSSPCNKVLLIKCQEPNWSSPVSFNWI